jgi:hypothetical protein
VSQGVPPRALPPIVLLLPHPNSLPDGFELRGLLPAGSVYSRREEYIYIPGALVLHFYLSITYDGRGRQGSLSMMLADIPTVMLADIPAVRGRVSA